MSKDDQIITTTAAAKLRGVTPAQVRNWIDEGLLPATKFGDVWMIRRGDVAKVPKRKRGPQPKQR